MTPDTLYQQAQHLVAATYHNGRATAYKAAASYLLQIAADQSDADALRWACRDLANRFSSLAARLEERYQ